MIDKMTDNLVDSQVMDVVSKTVIHTNGENNSNVEREKTLMYRFKVYARSGRPGFAYSDEYASQFYPTFNKVYRALINFFFFIYAYI